MLPEVQNEVNRIKLGDKRVGKSEFSKAAEKILDVDMNSVKASIKAEVRRKALSAVGEMLISIINKLFNSPRSNSYSAGPWNPGQTTETVSYKNYSAISARPVTSAPAPSGGKHNNFSDLIYREWKDADNLKQFLIGEIMRKGNVTVNEMYDEIGDPSNLEPTDSHIGWTDLSNAYIGMENGYYRLYLPPLETIVIG